jgi:hypothetical protein
MTSPPIVVPSSYYQRVACIASGLARPAALGRAGAEAERQLRCRRRQRLPPRLSEAMAAQRALQVVIDGEDVSGAGAIALHSPRLQARRGGHRLEAPRAPIPVGAVQGRA